MTYDPDGEDGDKMVAVIAIAQSLAIMEKNLEAQGGWADGIAGVKSLTTFGLELPDFAGALNNFISIVSGLHDEQYNQTKIDNALTIAQALSDFQDQLPSVDGWWQSVVGNKDLGPFSTNVTKLGTALASFATDIVSVDMDESQNALDVITLISNFIDSLESDAGVFQKLKDWFGGSSERNLLSITQTMATVGTNLNTFATSIANSQFEGAVDKASVAFADMSLFVDSLDKKGGLGENLLAFFGGDKKNNLINTTNAMATFGENLLTFATGVNSTQNLGTGFEQAKALFGAFAEFNQTLKDQKKMSVAGNLAAIGGGLDSFGSYLSQFWSHIATANAQDLNAAAQAIAALTQAVATAAEIDPTDVPNLAAMLMEFALQDFSLAGGQSGAAFISSIVDGLQNTAGTVNTTVTTIVDNAAAEATHAAGSFYATGVALGAGLSNGIAASSGGVIGSAIGLASRVVSALRSRWDIHSPSGVGKELGMYFDLGVAGGIGEYARTVSTQAASMGESTVEAAKAMLRGVNAGMLDDMDTTPTIRPVLDLSGVQSGVSAIGSMFANNPALDGGMFRGVNVSRNVGMLQFDGAKILGGQSNKDVINEMHTLQEKLGVLSQEMTNMQVVLDTGVLVGAAGSQIDKRLGVLAARRGRGN